MMALWAFPKVKVSEQAVAAIVLSLLKLVALSKIFTAIEWLSKHFLVSRHLVEG
jgi:hypothetical protein